MTRTITFDPNGWEDCLYWQTQDRKTPKRIKRLGTDDHIVILQARDHY